MARNAEKAMTTLARWRQAHSEDAPERARRPYLASECDQLPDAERWRNQIVREVARKVAQIQNAGLGEFRIRDLNDEINKLLREKSHWEARIKELGGPDYARTGPKMLDREGREVPGNRGYRYFGAARDLPGVRELFEQEPPPPPRKTRAELMKDIDADYYGFLDDEDGVLVPRERQQERLAVAAWLADWRRRKEAGLLGDDADPAEAEEAPLDADDSDEEAERHASAPARFVAHVPVPSQREVEAALVERKKRELLARYASDALREEEDHARQLAGAAPASPKVEKTETETEAEA
ncbi:pre-mRNA-splicing factor ISY1 homolog [Amphibalanus amphitrite]|uniref:pre-mRNA-splicing factor ISY1 homolog n=1 Tax=Amphibalanus amphitrite TaxID=1232801 RepID=UPI001C9086A1|nr:pre-mRNA-splicing factor ISY1 homolog [Amphibalanus amphitrite]XP_043214860.1 pre-mRNA-splicing factor ISY1 homolog [Amphibalanus amphitrite]XP_043214861.1 pre-mRNA-splicing factor ISY1 homolog [Amphibalanus amphitrite]